MCGNDLMHGFDCGPTHAERIASDMKVLKERTGIDFDQFADLMWRHRDYAVQHWPDMVKGPNDFEFDLLFLTDHGNDALVIMINSKTKKMGRSVYFQVKDCIDVWIAEAERESLRRQLRSHGIHPEW